jgi:hypothetical protein
LTVADDIVARAKAVLARRWEQPGPGYTEHVPRGVVELGDWASEHLPELLAEVERERSRSRDLHYAIDQLRKDAPPCDGGCNPNDGPQEECSAHGRTPADLWRQLDIVRKQRDDAVAEVEKLRTALCDVAIDQYLREKGMTL